ncbi:DUF192 domain-containing protein [Candidatus Nitrosotenuis aquarius]|uniref:DUF192 domain-containing protein n=1 Tax=Candidatus Nitrosotenuis aquarius TaxID=1846278 RepID=UPI000C1E646A|nr:DUF192 domain-containing protein [Candidatus Nitrosotenuis aquarius]
MPNIKTIAIISVVMATAAAIIYIINNQAYETGLEPQSNKERYHQAKIDIDGFEILADVAYTDEQLEKGLSIKDNLNEDEGMLFIFQNEGQHNFWMNNMKFPIDILWLDAAGKVIHIESNLQPCTSEFNCTVYEPQNNSLYVLETVAGFAEKHQVEIGTDIDFELIR